MDANKLATAGHPTDHVTSNTPNIREAELTISYEVERATLLLALNLIRVKCPTEHIPIFLYLKLFRVVHMTSNITTGAWTMPKAPPAATTTDTPPRHI